MLEALDLRLAPSQLNLLARHFDLLLRWNRKINLTSIRSTAEILTRHFGEALFLARALNLKTGTLADLGSGAGFPGFPFAVASPGVQVTLVESSTKKVAFLKEVARPCPNVTVFHGRFEDLDRHFDWTTLRAVAPGRLLPQIRTKSRHVALLIGEDKVQQLARSPLFSWQPPLRLPWGRSRMLLIGGE
jgi:16S rRNA (guanine527-N7)-methyltransferase